MKVKGNITRFRNGIFEGWALNADNPANPIKLELIADQQPVLTCTASRYRKDIELKHGYGYCGFLLQIPQRFFDGVPRRYLIQLQGSDIKIGEQIGDVILAAEDYISPIGAVTKVDRFGIEGYVHNNTNEKPLAVELITSTGQVLARKAANKSLDSTGHPNRSFRFQLQDIWHDSIGVGAILCRVVGTDYVLDGLNHTLSDWCSVENIGTADDYISGTLLLPNFIPNNSIFSIYLDGEEQHNVAWELRGNHARDFLVDSSSDTNNWQTLQIRYNYQILCEYERDRLSNGGASECTRGNVIHAHIQHLSDRIFGFCNTNNSNGEPASIYIQIDDVLFAPQRCDQLADQDFYPEESYSGFTFSVPDSFHDGESHEVRARTVGRHSELPGSPFTFRIQRKVGFDRINIERAKQFCDDTIIAEYFSEIDMSAEVGISSPKRLAICCSYFTSPSWNTSHRRMFQYLKSIGCYVVNVHALGGEQIDNPTCNGLIDHSIIKRNVGYDFGSWYVGYSKSRKIIDTFEQVIFANDSCFGPLSSSNDALTDFLDSADGIFGLTDSHFPSYHLQSYFFGVGKSVRDRTFLWRFFDNHEPTSDKSEVIRRGEIGLGKALAARGIVPTVMCPYYQVAGTWLNKIQRQKAFIKAAYPINPDPHIKQLDDYLDCVISNIHQKKPPNPTHMFWDTLILDYSFPFVKKEFVVSNPINVPNHSALLTIVHSICPTTYNELGAHAIDGLLLFPPIQDDAK